MSLAVVEQLREQIRSLESGTPGLTGLDAPTIPVHPVLEGLVRLRPGSTCTVDSASLALALAAGASRAGDWVGFAGWPDFGAEAAAQWGIDLARTVLVPEPGDDWLEVTAAMVDVLRVVVLRPPVTVAARPASVIEARLRARSAALVAWGDWPRADQGVGVEQVTWLGAGRGEGRLRERQVRVVVRRGAQRPVRADLAFPA